MPLQAGAARVCITPNLGAALQGSLTERLATRIHDDLWAKALVLDNGERRVGIVVCDIIALTGAIVEPAKALVAERCGIPPENLLVSATHTHTGPVTMQIAQGDLDEAYLAELSVRIADAVVMAADRLEPAQLGFATGACPSEVHNRRWHMADGTVRFNPGYQHPELVEPAGPTDPTLSLFVVRTPERRPIAALANLSLHYVGSPAYDISADYFGCFAAALQRCAGAEFVAMLSNGCQGDINNCNFRRPAPTAPHPYYHSERVANVVAGEAWRIWNTLWEEDFHSEVVLGAALEKVPMRPRRPTPEQIEAGRKWMAAHTIDDDLWAWTYAREHVAMAEGWPEERDFPVQVLRLGDVGVVGFPAEPLVEIGLDLRARSPIQPVVPIGLANDMAGYVGTDEQLDLGGYESTLCRWVFSPKGTAQAWVDTAVRLLDGLR